MTFCFAVFLILIVAVCPTVHADQSSIPRPNVVLILTDDMGYADVVPFGSSEIDTPNLTRLAQQGTRLTDCYVTAPICVPSRMGLLTGRYQQRYGVYDNVYSVEANRRWVQQTTLADHLQAAGYRTANVGKWHLSGNRSPWKLPPPHERGFDEFVGIDGGMDDFWPGTTLLRRVGETYQEFPSPDYLTDFFGDEARKFIKRQRANPFFLYLAFNAPHAPLQAPEADQQAIDADWISQDRRTYNAMVRAVDRNIGKVLDALEHHGLCEKTLIIFLNDNGGGGNNAAKHTRNTARNLPYRGHKFDVTEGGIRVPMIISFPGRVPQGEAFSGLASSIDVVPTVLAATGTTRKDPPAFDGVNLLPYLDGQKQGNPHDQLCWLQRHWRRANQHPVDWDSYQFAIRRGHWKAVRMQQRFNGSPNRDWELYDLSRDPSELQDVATEYPEVVGELAEKFADWRKRMHPPL